MSNKNIQHFKCQCPLTHIGVYGIHRCHKIPNIPCNHSSNDILLNQHLQYYHHFDSIAARKLVLAVRNKTKTNKSIFKSDEVIVKRTVSVESYKCKCPLAHNGVVVLPDEHDITNVPCGRADKKVLCFQHLQYHHNLSSHAAKKIVGELLSSKPLMIHLFENDDLATQSKCAVRKFKDTCPLLSPDSYDLSDQKQVQNIPCDRGDKNVLLFYHLTYFHKLNSKSATKLINTLISNKDTIVSTNQQVKRTKKLTEKHHEPKEEPSDYSNKLENFSTTDSHSSSPINTYTSSDLMTEKLDNNPTCCSIKEESYDNYEIFYSYSTNDMLNFKSFL